MGAVGALILSVVSFEFDIGGNPVTLLHFLGLLIVLPVGFMVGKRVGRFVGRQMSRAMSRRMPMITSGTTVGRAPLPTGMAVLSGLAGGVARWLTTAVVWLIGLEAVGLDMAIFKVMVGVLALGIPFATAAISRNGVAGMVVLLEGTLKEGYLVKLGSGQVGRLGVGNLFRTPIHTGSGSTVYVPSGDLLGSVVEVITTDKESAPVGARFYVDVDSSHPDVVEALKEAFGAYLVKGADMDLAIECAGQLADNPMVVAYNVGWVTVRRGGPAVSEYTAAGLAALTLAGVNFGRPF